ncbi:MAG TPA: ribose-phosphate diphosphokinase [Thermoplasmata archaeon]|nr:ribose-phosphate diphosphokinase [Thermoplasmata archaeon]
MYIIGGTASKDVATDLSRELRCPLVDVTVKRFADGECYVRINDDVQGEDVLVVQTTYPDKNIVEMFLLQDAAAEAKVHSIYLVVPYYGYARQDRKFQEGEPVSAKAMAKHLSMHADGIVTVDPHKEHVLDFFDIPAHSCSAVPEIAKYLKKKNVEVILAPDEGAVERAKTAAEIIECPYGFLEKKRIDDETIEMTTKKFDVEGKTIAILDDIISTGGTMTKAVEEMKKQGAEEVYVACTHGLFVGDAVKKLCSTGCKEILSTDTVVTPFSIIKVAPALASAINQMFTGRVE